MIEGKEASCIYFVESGGGRGIPLGPLPDQRLVYQTQHLGENSAIAWMVLVDSDGELSRWNMAHLLGVDWKKEQSK